MNNEVSECAINFHTGDGLVSNEASAIAMNHSRASGTAKIVLLGIANHDGDGGAWPSMGRLAVYANVSVRNVHYAVEKLVDLGEIEVDLNGGGGSQSAAHMRPNLYHFLLKCPPNCDGTKHHRMLCTVCRKELPTARRMKLTHLACHPLSPATPPVASDTHPLSPATDELNPEPPTTDNPSTYLLKREADEKDASGGPVLPASAITHGLCPKRLESPHAYSKAGVCIDCGASAATTGDAA